jgi:hypothetical protein
MNFVKIIPPATVAAPNRVMFQKQRPDVYFEDPKVIKAELVTHE